MEHIYVEVIWIDSNITEVQTDEIPMPVIIISCGILVKKCDDYITIARDFIDGEWRGQMAIPQLCIKELTHLTHK